MGTTVTVNHGLIKPDTDESIKANLPTFAGWAAQNGINQDKLDALFRVSTGSWSPTWTADTTNPTLGTGGFVEGKYVRLWPRMVLCYWRVFAGTASFSGGLGNYRTNLPFAIAPEIAAMNNEVPLGRGCLISNSVPANATLLLPRWDVAAGNVVFGRDDNGYWVSTAPFTFGNNDRASMYMMYPTAVP